MFLYIHILNLYCMCKVNYNLLCSILGGVILIIPVCFLYFLQSPGKNILSIEQQFFALVIGFYFFGLSLVVNGLLNYFKEKEMSKSNKIEVLLKKNEEHSKNIPSDVNSTNPNLTRYERSGRCFNKIVIIISIVSLVVLGILVNQINLDGIHSLLNAYITINAAFLALLFAAIIVCHPTLSEKKEESIRLSKSFERITLGSGAGILISIICLFLSYVESTQIIIKCFFLIVTMVTFIVVVSTMLGITDFLAEKKHL